MKQVPSAATAWVVCTGVTLTLVAGTLLASQARADRDERLRHAADVVRTSLVSQLQGLEASMEGLRNGLTEDPSSGLSWPVDRRQVSQAVARGFADRSLSTARAVSLVRAVRPGELSAYQAVVAADVDGFSVHPAPEDRVAYVVEVLHPTAGNEEALGFDMASEDRRRTAIEDARDTGLVAATPPLELVQPGGERAVIMVVPAYSTFDVPDTAPVRRQTFTGAITLVLDPQALLDSAAMAAPAIDLAVVDVGRIGLAGSASATGEGVMVVGDRPEATAIEMDLHVGDRRWRLLATPGEEFGGPGYLPTALTVVALLLLTAMTAMLVHVLRTRERKATALVDARTRLLQQSEDELRKLNAVLCESDALKTSFLVTVSHELRTPLTTIRGFADLLDRDSAGLTEEDRSTFLRQLSHSARGLSDLLNEVLEFAELEHLGPAVSTQAINLPDVVHDVTRRYAETNHLAIRGGDQVVLADPHHLRRALHAVLANARAYSPPGSAIGVWVRPGDGRVEVVIDDEGPGIPDHERERVFQRFYRGHRAAAGTVPGTGIGLTLARHLVEAMGGQIVIDDAPGGGTRVILELVASHGSPSHADEIAEAIT